MNQRVIDILELLIDQVVHEKNLPQNGAELIQRLMKLGYNIDEIDAAFELIFSCPERIVFSDFGKEHQPSSAMRVFRQDECLKLSVDVRGALTQMINEHLLDRNELEEVLLETMKFDGMDVNLDELHSILMRIIDDEARLSDITRLFWSREPLPNCSREELN